MNMNALLNQVFSKRRIFQLKNSKHIVDQLFIQNRLSQQQHNTFIAYERLRHLLWRHRDVKRTFHTYCQGWGRLRGNSVDTFENPELERFWLWIERHLKGRRYIHFLDHVVETGQTKNTRMLSFVLNNLYDLWCEFNLSHLTRCA